MVSLVELSSEMMIKPPEGCRGKFCDGGYVPDLSMPVYWEICPLDGPACPFHRQRLLRPLGIGERYQAASIEQIANDGSKAIVQSYVDSIGESVSEGKGLYIEGGVGVGKTSILALVAYAAVVAGYSVAYWYAGSLFDRLHRQDEAATDLAYQCDLLLLDDFGVQYSADWTVTRFDALIEHRYANQKAMCITTNVSREELEDSDTWCRVYDRWKEMCEGISAGRESMR